MKNGLVMSVFWDKTVENLVLAGDGPELMVNLHCLYCCESFVLMSLYSYQMTGCPGVKDC